MANCFLLWLYWFHLFMSWAIVFKTTLHGLYDSWTTVTTLTSTLSSFAVECNRPVCSFSKPQAVQWLLWELETPSWKSMSLRLFSDQHFHGIGLFQNCSFSLFQECQWSLPEAAGCMLGVLLCHPVQSVVGKSVFYSVLQFTFQIWQISKYWPQ